MGQKCQTSLSKKIYTYIYIYMTNKHIDTCTTSFIITELQIKATMEYHYTPIRIATI